MRLVKFRKYEIDSKGDYVKDERGRVILSDFIYDGKFLEWGDGIGNFTIGLVELESGKIESVDPNNIMFVK